MIVHLLLSVAIVTNAATAYNLDSESALILEGPPGSYFGYSVAQHAIISSSAPATEQPGSNSTTFKSFTLIGAPRAESSLVHNQNNNNNNNNGDTSGDNLAYNSLLSSVYDTINNNNNNQAQRPGAVYKCEFSSNAQCQQIDFEQPISAAAALLQQHQQSSQIRARDLSGNNPSPGQLFSSAMEPKVRKDNQWLGVSVKSQGAGGLAVACAHRQVLEGPDYRWAQGVCYSLTKNLTIHKQWEPCQNRPVNKAHEEFGYCQAGTSSDISDTSDIVIGSPGPYTWRGTVWSNSINFGLRDDKTWYMAPVIDQEAQVDKYSYLGMSVVSGRFFNKQQYFVSGAPRANGTGQVLFMTKRDSQFRPKDSTFKTDLKLSGEQFASSFGYTLAKLDFNGDGLLDLVVGAPFYYTKKEGGGAVYAYANQQGKTMQLATKLTGKPESRFGFALSSCGDLNKDKYDDLAVGAPYEQGGGAVYIYFGSSKGLKSQPAQIISPSSMQIPIQTFGYSLSGGMDMDRNDYPDLTVGSYSDDKVVVLRGRPIVQIKTKIEGDLTRIDPDKSVCDGDKSPMPCFKFNACFELDNSNGPQSSQLSAKQLSAAQQATASSNIKLMYRIEAETFTGQKFSRVKFPESLNSERPNIVEKVVNYVHNRNKKCYTQKVYIENKRDIQSPIQFKLSYSLIPTERLSADSNTHRADYMPSPILNQEEAQRVFVARFMKDCGSNDICESYLDLDGQLTLPKETLGLNEPGRVSEKQVNVTLRVKNQGEPAYDTQLFVEHPEIVSYFGVKVLKHAAVVECQPINKTIIKCDMGNPMPANSVSRLVMSFNTHNNAGPFDFNIFVNTTSTNNPQGKTTLKLSGMVPKKVERPIATPAPPPEIRDVDDPPAWVVISSILLGIILLSLLVYILYRYGFFERANKHAYQPTETEDRFG